MQVEAAQLLHLAGYRGERMDLGLVRLLAAPSTAVHDAAVTLVTARGPSETLVAELERFLHSRDPRLRLTSAEHLIEWGRATAPVRDALAELSAHLAQEVRRKALVLLARHYEPAEAYAALEARLAVEDLAVRGDLAETLCELGCSGPALDAAVAELLAARDALASYRAERLIRRLPRTDSLLARLVAILIHDGVRSRALQLLDSLHQAGDATEDALVELLNTADRGARTEAIRLVHLVPRTPRMVARIAALLSTTKGAHALEVARLLRELGGSGNELEAALLRLLRDGDAEIRSAAADLLEETAPTPFLREDLRSLLHEGEPRLRLQAAALLSVHDRNYGPLTEALQCLLEVEIPDVQVEAVRLLLNLGASGESVLAPLMGLCETEDMDVRFRAHELLRQLQPTEGLVQALLASVGKGDLRVRAAAAGVLRDWNPSEEVSVRALVALLEAGDEWLQEQIGHLLNEWQPSEALVQALVSLLHGPSDPLRPVAIRLLGKQRNSATALHAMLQIASDDFPESHQALQFATSGLSATPEHVVQLQRLLYVRESDGDVQRAAREWLYEWLLERLNTGMVAELA
ncbi:hypothetical protein [Longimicrobium sp.]|uniref:hypothetical protein n=1 Tax=Longimicrobium sp. TaxID=2029185 RepID=UPI002F9454EA